MTKNITQIPKYKSCIIKPQLLSILVSTMPTYQARDFIATISRMGFPKLFITRYNKGLSIETIKPTLILYTITKPDYHKIENARLHFQLHPLLRIGQI